MKKAIIVPVLLSFVCVSAAFAIPEKEARPLAPLLLSAAQNDPKIISLYPPVIVQPVLPPKPKSELGRILDLSLLLKTTDATIVYKGSEYKPRKILGLIRLYIYKHYKNEKAEDWISAWAFKSRKSGNVYYVKYPNGKTRFLRDVLLEELSCQK